MRHINIRNIYFMGEIPETLTDGIFYDGIHEKANHYNELAAVGTAPDELTKLMFQFTGFLQGLRLANILVIWDFELID